MYTLHTHLEPLLCCNGCDHASGHGAAQHVALGGISAGIHFAKDGPGPPGEQSTQFVAAENAPVTLVRHSHGQTVRICSEGEGGGIIVG